MGVKRGLTVTPWHVQYTSPHICSSFLSILVVPFSCPSPSHIQTAGSPFSRLVFSIVTVHLHLEFVTIFPLRCLVHSLLPHNLSHCPKSTRSITSKHGLLTAAAIRKLRKLRWGSVALMLTGLNRVGTWLCPYDPSCITCGWTSVKIFTTFFRPISRCEPYVRSCRNCMLMWVWFQALSSLQRNHKYVIWLQLALSKKKRTFDSSGKNLPASHIISQLVQTRAPHSGTRHLSVCLTFNVSFW